MKLLFYSTVFICLIYFRLPVLGDSEKDIPDTVKIGTYIVSLHDINFHDKEYTIRFWMWMLYKNAEFDFANRVEVPNAKSLEKPETLVGEMDNKIWVLLKMKCIMKESWRVQDYPFDMQQLEVHVENSEFDTRSLVFVADTGGSHYDPKLTLDGWKVNKIEIKTSVSKYKTNFGDSSLKKQESEYASFDILVEIKRDTLGLFLKLFICMYIAFFIAFMSFFIHPDHIEASFGLQVGGLFASVGNKYIIDSILPETPSFTLVDSLHAVTYLFVFFIILFSVISINSYKKGEKERSRKINKIGIAVTFFSYLLLNVVLIMLAIFQ